MQREGYLLCSQDSILDSCPDPNESIPRFYVLFLYDSF
jgi:hypothetical protein